RALVDMAKVAQRTPWPLRSATKKAGSTNQRNLTKTAKGDLILPGATGALKKAASKSQIAISNALFSSPSTKIDPSIIPLL
ncbi:MAG: hypothetical protein Q4Q42_05915, partial [Planctomycetia bacterium]|nr:hypothetical protein [Planctomycetia bacterium]